MSTPRHVQITLQSEGWPIIAEVINSIEDDALHALRTGKTTTTDSAHDIQMVETIRNRIRALAKEAGVAQDPFRSTDA